MRYQGTGWRLGVCLALLTVSGAAAQQVKPQEPERTRLQRLEALGKLWGEVRYHHPWMLSRSIDWDAAFLSAVPKVEAATSAEEYAAAVQSMLDALGDPATKVKSAQPPATLAPPTLRPLVSVEKDVLLLDPRTVLSPGGYQALWEMGARYKDAFVQTRNSIVDLRMRGFTEEDAWSVASAMDEIMPLFIETELVVPGLRSTLHKGYKPQTGTDPTYTTGFAQDASLVLQGSGRKVGLVVFLLDDHSVLSPRILALRAAGKALLVGEGPVTDALVAEPQSVPLGEKLMATVRTTETVLPPTLDEQLPARADLKAPDAAFERALVLAGKKTPPQGSTAPTPLEARWRPDKRYADSPYPSRELRLLAAVRLWNVVELFFPYKHLMDVDWSQRLPVLLERFEAAKDAKEYAIEVAKAAADLHDGHVSISGPPAYDELWGGDFAPFDVRDIEGKVVVTEIHDPEVARQLAVGDILEKMNGELIEDRLRRLEPIHQASTAFWTRYFNMVLALRGPKGSEVTFTVRDAKGVREVKLTRVSHEGAKEAPHEPFKLLEGNIGYVNLVQLEPGEVTEAMRTLQGTRGIVFDLRGYPRGTSTALAPYLNTKGAKVWTTVELPVVAGSSEVTGRLVSKQPLGIAEVPVYRGRVVTLIDERAVSRAEHQGLMFEATCGATFVGSPTAGTNGNMTYTSLPGGIWMSFTGVGVLHADGSQLQRKGIIPQVFVRPTLAGLRAGRDEVLERALRLIKEPEKRAAPAGPPRSAAKSP